MLFFIKLCLFLQEKTSIAKIKQPNPENFQNPTVFITFIKEKSHHPKVMAFSLILYIIYYLLKNSSIPLAAAFPAPIARITVAAPVTASPPAYTAALEVLDRKSVV